METHELNQLKSQLVWRKERIQEAITGQIVPMHLVKLLKEVDSALERIDNGNYGMCVICNQPIEKERLYIDPIAQVCLEHLTNTQQKELEADLAVANSIQKGMLPKNDQQIKGFEFYYHYEAAGIVSGDYCDVIDPGKESDSLYFVLADVSGKGIAASMLMTHLHAVFQSMIPLGLKISELVANASRLLCESTTSSHYATLLCVKSFANGKVEICNAGHCHPLLARSSKIIKIESTGIPVGIFCESEYHVNSFQMGSGELLVLYSDGLTEASTSESFFGMERLEKFLRENNDLSAKNFVIKLVEELNQFLSGAPRKDDLTIMAIKKI